MGQARPSGSVCRLAMMLVLVGPADAGTASPFGDLVPVTGTSKQTPREAPEAPDKRPPKARLSPVSSKANPVSGKAKPAARGEIGIASFDASPFPFDGMIPEQNVPFLEGPPAARFHVAPRGGKLMADKTYFDRRSLLVTPAAFDPTRPGAAIIVFFHGNLATLDDVKGRQGVPRQLIASGLNAALVAPALAVKALDSSPGRFWERGFFQAYLDEAESRLAAQSHGRFTKEQLTSLPVIIAAYSGGYLATAFTLHYGSDRIRGVLLLDALFGEPDKFKAWIEADHSRAFFVSAYSKASSALNTNLEHELATAGVSYQTKLPGALRPGDVVFLAAPAAVHNDFVTRAWAADPLATLLRLARPARTAEAPDQAARAQRRSEPAEMPPCPADTPDCDPGSHEQDGPR